MITFDPGPCESHRRYPGERCGSCMPIGQRIVSAYEGELGVARCWPSAIALSCAWAALLGRAADQAEARLRVAMRHAHKRAVVEDTIARGPVLVFVDPRVADADLPAHLTEPTALRFGHQLSPAIPDLAIDDRGISGTLTFGGRSHRCVLPWPGIYAVRLDGSDHSMVWPEDVLTDIATVAKVSRPVETEAPAAPPPKRGGHLRLVP